jgi:hypothetical protein
MPSVRTPAAAWKMHAPLHLTLLVINLEHLLRLFSGELSALPPTSTFYDWMANNDTESFFCALCVSWVFYREGCAETRRPRRHSVPPSILCEGIWTKSGHIHYAHDKRLVRSDTEIRRLPLFGKMRASCPRTYDQEDIAEASSPTDHSSHPKIGSSKC